jgi:hypothetical protein
VGACGCRCITRCSNGTGRCAVRNDRSSGIASRACRIAPLRRRRVAGRRTAATAFGREVTAALCNTPPVTRALWAAPTVRALPASTTTRTRPPTTNPTRDSTTTHAPRTLARSGERCRRPRARREVQARPAREVPDPPELPDPRRRDLVERERATPTGATPANTLATITSRVADICTSRSGIAAMCSTTRPVGSPPMYLPRPEDDVELILLAPNKASRHGTRRC